MKDIKIDDIIEQPEKVIFDKIETRIIIYSRIISPDDITSNNFITLEEISNKFPNTCIEVKMESGISGRIYRYNNYNDKKWQLVGYTIGYA